VGTASNRLWGSVARINIEDSVFRDIRFTKLMMKMTSFDEALGAMVRSWILAQKWYLTPEKMIPAEEWSKQLLPEAIIEVGLAERVGDHIRVRGADEQFAWLLQRVEAGRRGGIKSGKNRKHEPNEALIREGARRILAKAVRNGMILKPAFCGDCGKTGEVIEGHHSDYSKPLQVDWLCKECHTKTHRLLRESTHIEANEAEAKQNEANSSKSNPSFSSSFSLSSSFSDSESKKEKKEKEGVTRKADKQPAKPKEEPKTKITWDKYRACYLAKHGSEPPQASAKDRANLSSLIDRYGKEKAVQMVEHFFTLPNGYYHRNFHPIGVLLKDSHSIHGSMTTGKVMTRGQAQNMERSHETRTQMQRIENGEV
jgi:hypothetical protein